METVFTQNVPVRISMCDARGRLGLAESFGVFQDIASEHAEILGIGGAAMFSRNAFWITVRTRVRFYARARMLDTLSVTTWPAKPGNTRCDRFYTMKRGDQLLAEGRTEWCVMDTQTHAVRTLDTIGLDPALPYSEARTLDTPYARFRHNFDPEADCACKLRVRPSDIDLGQHMNNVAYLRMLTDSFSVSELNALRPEEMEILFCAPCFEGEELRILRRETDYGYEFGVMRPDDKYAALALMRTAGK